MRSERAIAACCFLVGVIVFSGTLGNGFVGWDDGAYVTNNPYLRSAAGLWKIWFSSNNEQYYPLTFTTYWIEYRLWGLDPFGYHLSNVVLHGINCGLLFLLARRIGLSRRAAVWTTLLFAVHPAQTMTVAWIAARKNLLSCLFTLLCILGWLRFQSDRRRTSVVIACVAFGLALLSKSSVLGIPIVLWILMRRDPGRTEARSYRWLLPMVALAGVSAVLTTLFEGKFVASTMPMLERPFVAAAALLWYVYRVVWPFGLVPIYARWSVVPGSWLWPATLMIVGSVSFALWYHRKTTPSHVHFGLLFFLVFLIPTLGFVPYGNLEVSNVSDHYLYLSCAGIFLIVSAAADTTASQRHGIRRVLDGAFAVVVVGLTLQAASYVTVFRDVPSMWQHTLSRNPSSYAARAGMGHYHASRKEWRLAAESFERAGALRPDLVEPHWGRARAYAAMGDYAAAREAVENAMAKAPSQPTGYHLLGTFAEAQHEYARAMRLYEESLSVARDYAPALVAIGSLHLGLAQRNTAAGYFRRAFALDPTNGTACMGTATCLRNDGSYGEALGVLMEGLRWRPEDVRLLNLRARILATAPDGSVRNGLEAIRLSRRALSLARSHRIELLDTLAAAYAEAGEFEQATIEAARAVELAGEAGDDRLRKQVDRHGRLFEQRIPLREGQPSG